MNLNHDLCFVQICLEARVLALKPGKLLLLWIMNLRRAARRARLETGQGTALMLGALFGHV
ncbi:hypothetical protein EKD04_011880 [Chloroflexales bacterium ZM16-3]|nr:hypothetical protein [Chloroflexales bacterium ZM16-3]